MLLPSSRFVLGFAAAAAAAAVAVPLAARTLAVASAGPEIVLAPPSLAAGGGVPYALGTDGTNFAVFNGRFGGQRLSPTGTLLDPTEIKFPYASVPDNGAGLAVAPSASGYLCVWNDYRIALAHLDAKLAPVEATPTTLAAVSSSDEAYVAIAKGASGYLVAWITRAVSSNGSKGTINAQRLDSTGALVGAAITLGPGDTYMTGPAVSYGGGNYEVVWGASASLLAVHVSEAGALLDPSPKTIATTLQDVPVIAATASEHVVAWRDAGRDGGAPGIFAARIKFDGTIVDPGGVEVSPSAEPSGLAYAPSTGLVMGWSPFGNYPPRTAILDEATLAISHQYDLPGSAYTSPAVASNGTTVLTAWAEQSNTGAATIGPSAALTGAPATLGWVTGHNGASQIASSGSGYFVAWQTGQMGAGGAIWGRRLDATGAPLGPPILVTVPPNGFIGDPVVVWTGAEYVVLFPVGQGTWYTVRVAPSGDVLDSMVGNIDVPTSVAQVSFTGGNGQLFEIVVTGQEVDIYPYDGKPGGFLAPGTPIKIFFTSTQASVAWLDATRFEIVFVGGPGLYASVVDTTTMTAKAPITIAESFYGYTQPLAARGEYETAVAAAPPDGGSMFVYRLDKSGAVMDGPYPTQSVSGASSTSLVWDGARYVLAWSRQSGDGGTVAYASDLGSPTSPFALSGAIQPFAENVLAAGPSIVPLGDGGALLVATRALADDTSVVGAPWTSGDKLPPLPMPDAGTDAGGGTDAGADASSDAGGDAGPGDDAGNPVDASGPIDSAAPIVTDAGRPAGPVDSGHIATDAGAPGASPGGANDSSGCSCRIGAEKSATSWPTVAAVLLAGLGLAGRRRRFMLVRTSPRSSRPHRPGARPARGPRAPRGSTRRP